MKAIVLSAGYGTRLGPLTKEIPKPMLPLCGQPLLERTIRYLAGQGITDLAINTHYKPESIHSYFGDGRRFGTRIHYTYEAKLLGTAGAVKNLASWIGTAEAFLVLYGDILTDQNLSPLWRALRASDAVAALCVHRRPHSNSIVTLDGNGRITRFVERPTGRRRRGAGAGWVNSAIQVLSRRVLDLIPSSYPTDLAKDIYVPYHRSEMMVGIPITGFRCAIDSAKRYRLAEQAVRLGYCRPDLGRTSSTA